MTPDPEPTEEKRGRHARADDDADERPAEEAAEDSTSSPAPSGGATATSTAAPPTEAPPKDEEPPEDDAPKAAAPPPPAPRTPQPDDSRAEEEPKRRYGGHSIGHHPAGFPLVLSAALVTGLSLVPLLLDQLDFDVATRAARSARSAATSWPAGGEPWFWPDWLATTAGITAVVVIVLALVGLRIPDLVVLVLAGLLTVTTARAAWATLDVVNSRLWELLPVCALCVLAFGLAATAAARFRSPRDDSGSGGGGGGAAGVLVGGWLIVVLLLFAGAAIASSAETNAARVAGPPQDVPGLLSIRAADAADLDDLRGTWVPQLAAAQVGGDDDAGASAFAVRHSDLASRLPALLVRGDDIAAADLDDTWWLTLGRQTFASDAEVQAWCAGNGIAECTPRQVAD